MDVASVYSLAQTQYATEIDEDNKRRNTRSTSSGSRGDTVSFSEEGKALAAEMAARKEVEKNGQSSAFERNPDGDAEEETGLAENAGGAGGSERSSSADIDAQIEKLTAQIRQLMQQMSSIMSGPASIEEKIAQGAPIEQRINGLEQQLQELLAQKRAEAQAGQSA